MLISEYNYWEYVLAYLQAETASPVTSKVNLVPVTQAGT